MAENEHRAKFDDDELAKLLEGHNDLENLDSVADLLARFYLRLRETLDPIATQHGEVHDPALEITREWMSYTLGGAE